MKKQHNVQTIKTKDINTEIAQLHETKAALLVLQNNGYRVDKATDPDGTPRYSLRPLNSRSKPNVKTCTNHPLEAGGRRCALSTVSSPAANEGAMACDPTRIGYDQPLDPQIFINILTGVGVACWRSRGSVSSTESNSPRYDPKPRRGRGC